MLGKIIRPLLTTAGIILIAILAIIWFASVVGIIFGYPLLNYLLPNVPFITAIGITNVLLLIGLPVVGLISFVMRMLFRARMNKKWAWGINLVWVINLFCLIMLGVFVGKQFKIGKQITISDEILNPLSDTLVIKAGDNPYGDAWATFDDLKIFNQYLVSDNVAINLVQSESKVFELVQENFSRGREIEEVRTLANQIESKAALSENTLTFPSYFLIPNGTKWRGQKVIFTLKIPKGKAVKLEGDITRFLNHVEKDRNRDNPWMEEGQIWNMDEEGLIIPGYQNTEEESDETSEFEFIDFQRLNLKGKMKIYIERSDEYSMRLSGHESYKKKVEAIQTGDLLDISADFEKLKSPVRLYLKMPDLSRVDLENTDDVKITGFGLQKLQINAGGTQEVKFYGEVDSLTLNLENETTLDIKGKGSWLNASLTDKSGLNAEDFPVRNAVLKTEGSHRVRMSVSETLNQKITDKTRLKIDGEPTVIKE